MDFGKRNIRSAGRSSGSVEITLPVELAILEGIACRLSLRDGLVPEIVLQPDLLVVMPVFEKLWSLLRLGLEETGEIVVEPRALREAYLEELRKHSQIVRDACHAMHVDYVQVDTSLPLDVTLPGFLADRAARMK